MNLVCVECFQSSSLVQMFKISLRDRSSPRFFKFSDTFYKGSLAARTFVAVYGVSKPAHRRFRAGQRKIVGQQIAKIFGQNLDTS